MQFTFTKRKSTTQKQRNNQNPRRHGGLMWELQISWPPVRVSLLHLFWLKGVVKHFYNYLQNGLTIKGHCLVNLMPQNFSESFKYSGVTAPIHGFLSLSLLARWKLHWRESPAQKLSILAAKRLMVASRDGRNRLCYAERSCHLRGHEQQMQLSAAVMHRQLAVQRWNDFSVFVRSQTYIYMLHLFNWKLPVMYYWECCCEHKISQ